MPKFFVNSEQVDNNKIRIIGKDVNHIKNVLRMKVGDELYICNESDSMNYKAKINDFCKDEIMCGIVETIENIAESNVKVHIYQGLPKADKMELIIQKSVELGVDKITPIEMKRCIVKLDEKDKIKKRERWQKIAEVAAKQSGRDIIPEICNIKNIKEIGSEFGDYDLVLLCYENEKEVLLKEVLKSNELKKNSENLSEFKIAVIIGPEGGVDISEVELMKKSGAKVISLGNRILRTETVALAILSIIMYEFERNEV
ncbi:MAG: 16S rRNA (uracil(1498)-N(3))-methyltransferase [Clostridia bacterium]|nr:16S rRNA (uracil(1498)-N(3))-methyltransferase [Clostridia bacterium]